MSEQIAELRKLLAESTADPWVYHDHEGIYGGTITDCNATVIARPDDFDDRENDFALICALRNSAPALLARLESLERLWEAVEEMPSHYLSNEVNRLLAALTKGPPNANA